MTKSIGIVLIATVAVFAADISAERIRIHTRFLSSDLMEGRGVGMRGGQLATEYLASQFALAGAKPAGENGSFFQKVPLVGVETQPVARLSASKDGRSESFAWLTGWVGVSHEQRPETQVDAEAVFVGHGITAPEFKWDDLKGLDVKGKVLVLFTNEPTSDSSIFDGRALTYYGRWTYKFEEATRRGAAGVIIIHTTPTAGYGWDVVRGSWGREQPFVKRAEGEHALALASWVTGENGAKLLAMAGKTVDDLLRASESRDFRPIPLGVRIRATLPTRLRELDTRNVAAIVEGSDPALKREAVIYSAHWDHLGIGQPVNGDSIYNGAIDNATGCAILLELARAWAALPQKPRRSALFLAVTAEEGGLRGSEYYGSHPLVPVSKTALALNYDALYPIGRARDLVVGGAVRTTVWPLVQQVAKRLELNLTPDAQPEQGHYFRSDHFSFAKAGIPAFSIERGSDYAGKPAGYFQQFFEEYNSRHYHQPSDEFSEDWDFTALEQAAQFGMLIGIDVANQDRLPDWRKGESFHR